MKRRDFFTTGARGILATLLILGGGLLWWRKGDDNCNLQHPCGNCHLFDNCQLPKRNLHDDLKGSEDHG